jgi:CTP:molybdopterin cytidylyltransferase MocA
MIVAIVLAAGRSERLGKSKPLAPCRDTTFLGAVLDTVSASRVDDVRVVLGHEADGVQTAMALPDDIVTVNLAYESGMLSSVQCGIASLPPGSDAFLIWPVDHPLVRVETVDGLVEAFVRTRPALVLPVRGDRRGHPVLFAAALAAELMAAPMSRGARAVVGAHTDDRVELAVDDDGVVADIDTPEAYLEWFGRPMGD